MEELPDEVLLSIFEYLPSWELMGNAARVCRRWAALLRHYAVAGNSLDALFLVHPGTRSLRLATLMPPLRQYLQLVPPLATQLRDLIVYSRNPFSEEHLVLLNNIPHLEHLDIFFSERVLYLEIIPYILRLRSFVINEVVAPCFLYALGQTKTLNALYMYGRSLFYPCREMSMLIRIRRHHLRELTLRCSEMHDAAFATIGQCENLTSLQLYSCWLMTDAGAMSVIKPRKLRRLHVTGARMLRTRSMSAFLDHLPPLIEELNLSMTWFGNEHIVPLSLALAPKLRVLELWQCRINPEGVLALAENLTVLAHLDLDLMLTNEQILELDKHPSLVFLRCLTEYAVKQNPYMAFKVEPRGDVHKVVTKKIKVVPTDEKYKFDYFRGSGEGYRGTLFYHWTQDIELDPIGTKSPFLVHEEADEAFVP